MEEVEDDDGAADTKSSDAANAAAAEYAHLTDGVDEAFPRISPDGTLVQLRRSRSHRRRLLTGEADEEADEEEAAVEAEAEADGADTADLGAARDALRVVREKLVRGEVDITCSSGPLPRPIRRSYYVPHIVALFFSENDSVPVRTMLSPSHCDVLSVKYVRVQYISTRTVGPEQDR